MIFVLILSLLLDYKITHISHGKREISLKEFGKERTSAEFERKACRQSRKEKKQKLDTILKSML